MRCKSSFTLVFFFLCLFYSCSNHKKEHLLLSIPSKSVQLPKEIPLNFTRSDIDEIGFFKAFTKDSLLVIQTVGDFSTKLKIYNKNTSKYIHSLGSRGKGPLEFMSLSLVGQFIDDDNISLWGSDNTKKKISLINISKSIDSLSISIEKEYPYNGDFFNIYNLNDSIFIGDSYNGHQMNLSLLNINSGKYKHLFSFFNEDSFIDDISLTSCNTTLKPDRSLVAYGMMRFNNLIIASSSDSSHMAVSIKGLVENKDKPSDEQVIYHGPLASTDKQIWSLLFNKPIFTSEILSKIIVYNWVGDPMYNFSPDIELIHFTIDTEKKCIYAIDAEYELYTCDISKYLII